MPRTAPIVGMSLGRGQSSGAGSAAQTHGGHRPISSSGETPALLQLTHRDDLPVCLTNRCISYEAIPTDTARALLRREPTAPQAHGRGPNQLESSS
jgi:hypothetical protein